MLSLYEELEKAQLTCPLTARAYIPSNVIRDRITWETVEPLLPSTLPRRYLPCWDSKLSGKIQGARKIIAILIWTFQEQAIEDLLLGDLTDPDLPISQRGIDLYSHQGRKITDLFTAWRPGPVKTFLDKQWMFLEQALDLDPDAAINIKLDGLPALQPAFCSPVEEFKNSFDKGIVIYKGILRSGDSSNFGGNVNTNNPSTVCVVVKTFGERWSKDFDKEKANLETIQSKCIRNAHLIRQLAICDEFRCIIFPLADGGDLNDLWNGTQAKTPADFLWAFQQMSGLAHALQDLHSVNIRHGDLKPANIFHFTTGGNGILKIADFGISRAHQQETFLRNGNTITSASTRAYEGPEVISKSKISRRYDCWSMGCVFLEFVVWLLYDHDALDSFYHARESETHSYYLRKPNYVSETSNLSDKVYLHPEVGSAIESLLADVRCCGTALEELVILIHDHLLLIDWKDRLCAACLHERLQEILARVKNEHSYLVNASEGHSTPIVKPLVIPEIFNRPRSQPSRDSTMQATSQ